MFVLAIVNIEIQGFNQKAAVLIFFIDLLLFFILDFSFGTQ